MSDVVEIKLTGKEVMFLLMAWDSIRMHNPKSFAKHGEDAASLRHKLLWALGEYLELGTEVE